MAPSRIAAPGPNVAPSRIAAPTSFDAAAPKLSDNAELRSAISRIGQLLPAAPVASAAQQVSKAPRVVTVSELTWAIKQTIEPRFARVLVRGEVADFRGPNSRGHLYFTLKDDTSQVGVTIWQSTAARMKFALKNGLSVIADGSIDIYQQAGRYSLIANRIEPEGLGALALAFEQLKEKLQAEGLFGDQRKKPRLPLPFIPRRIGVVTSVAGAALRDFLKVLHRRHPKLAVLVIDARVQGDGAAIDVARGIRRLGKTDVDVIVVTRGGGSVEDLWAFNDELVARAIFDARVPVVSAIGHEIDVTLSDMVADFRAPTPSAAAEALAPVLADLSLHLQTLSRRSSKAIERRTHLAHRDLASLRARLGDPRRGVTQRRFQLNALSERLAQSFRRRHRARHDQLRLLEKRLQRARPQARLVEMRSQLDALHKRLQRASPLPKLAASHHRLAAIAARLPAAIKIRLQHERSAFRAEAARLNALSPLAVLGRGYAIVYGPHGEILRTGAEVAAGDAIEVQLPSEVRVLATVTGKK